MEKKELNEQIEIFRSRIENEENVIANKFVNIFYHFLPEGINITGYKYSRSLGFTAYIEVNKVANLAITWDNFTKGFHTRLCGMDITKDNCINVFIMNDLWKHQEEIETEVAEKINYDLIDALINKFEELKRELLAIEAQEEEELNDKLFTVGNVFHQGDASYQGDKIKTEKGLLGLFAGNWYVLHHNVWDVEVRVIASKPNAKKFQYKVTWMEDGDEMTKEGCLKKEHVVDFIHWENRCNKRDDNDTSWFIK